MICNECIFHKVIAERGQDSCSLRNDPVEAVKACVSASVHDRCDHHTTRDQVIEMSDALLAVQRQRNQLITEIAEVEELICRAQAALERLRSGTVT